MIHIINIIIGLFTILFSFIIWGALVGLDQIPWYIASMIPLLNISVWLICYVLQVKYNASKKVLTLTFCLEVVYVFIFVSIGNS